MVDFFLELFSEEIPARFQRDAANNLKKLICNKLVENDLTYENANYFVSPRHIALIVSNIPSASNDKVEIKRGPKIDAPQQAINGFLRSNGLKSIDEATIESDKKGGQYYVAKIKIKGRLASNIIAEFMPGIISNFPWPKSMRWGEKRLSWVRPLHSIIAILNNNDNEAEIISFAVDGIKSSNFSYGHRFLSPEKFYVNSFDDYLISLEKAKVILDSERRKNIILNEAKQLAFLHNLELIEDEALLEEVAGLVEWPVILSGNFAKNFLQLPKEVIITTIKNNQKSFCLTDKRGNLANKFIIISNMDAKDGGKLIIDGNERVIAARLSDALFFYENDLKIKLEDLLPKLREVIFHAKLGSQYERVERIIELAANIARKIGADENSVRRAAKLAKADLVTQMVNEFANLQGIMGRYYALNDGESEQVANAIADHYRPLGPKDNVPTEKTAICVALADKLDMLNQFWQINEKPTGSRDPFALRRAALGIIRILVENKIDFALEVEPDLLKFFHDRLKIMLRDKGLRHDLVDAVITKNSNNMLKIMQRINALSSLLQQKEGENLLAGYKRAVNILLVEEKRDKNNYLGEVDESLFNLPQEKELFAAISLCAKKVTENINKDDYFAAINALAKLHKPVDEFFDNVLVNDKNSTIRKNRLNLLASLRNIMHMVADFTKIEG